MKPRIIEFRPPQTHVFQSQPGGSNFKVVFAESYTIYPVDIDKETNLPDLCRKCGFRFQKKIHRIIQDSSLEEVSVIPDHDDYALFNILSIDGGTETSATTVREFLTALQYVPATLREILCFSLSFTRPRPLEYDIIALATHWYDLKEKERCLPHINTAGQVRISSAIASAYTPHDVFLVRKVGVV